MWVKHHTVLALALRRGSFEMGARRSAMRRLTYDAGEMSLVPRHGEKWFRNEDLNGLCIAISDAALTSASDGTNGEVELRRMDNLVDARMSALVEAVNAERIAGFPSGRLFLDSVEQALAVALVNGYAVQDRSVQTHGGGLGSARLRRIKEFVDAKMEDGLSLREMAQSVELSTAHFSRMFRKSTGESPHHYVLRHRVERAKEMLRAAEGRVLDVAVACGFKTQQHFARCSVGYAESVLENIDWNVCSTERLAFCRPAPMIRLRLWPPVPRAICDVCLNARNSWRAPTSFKTMPA
jgi:AraC family transcriptional regulator